MKKKWVAVIALLATVGCGRQTGPVNRNGQRLYTMQVMPYKTFEMDENTSQITQFMQLFTVDDTLRFTMYNSNIYGKNILVFDLSTGKAVDSVRLHKEGPHNAGGNIQGYYIHNMDSVYLYDFWQYTFVLVNRGGEIIDRINLSEKFPDENSPDVTPSSPFPAANMPIRRTGNTLILQGMTRGVTDAKRVPTVTALSNLSDNTVKFANTYPAVYGDMKNLHER
jgi:hypothetical protein